MQSVSQFTVLQRQLDWGLTYFYEGLQAVCIINQKSAVCGKFTTLRSFEMAAAVCRGDSGGQNDSHSFHLFVEDVCLQQQPFCVAGA